MAITNCSANLAGLLAPIAAGNLINNQVNIILKISPKFVLIIFFSNFFLKFQPTIAQWQKVFFIAAAIYIAAGTFYNLCGSGQRQPWDNPDNDEKDTNILESQHQTSPNTLSRLPPAITATQ